MANEIGIDIIEIKEISKIIEKSNYKFLRRVFTEKEIKYCSIKKDYYTFFAVVFALKEALLKALGTGWGNGIGWHQVEVISQNNNSCKIVLHDRAETVFVKKGYKKIICSFSQTGKCVIAIVLLE